MSAQRDMPDNKRLIASTMTRSFAEFGVEKALFL